MREELIFQLYEMTDWMFYGASLGVFLVFLGAVWGFVVLLHTKQITKLNSDSENMEDLVATKYAMIEFLKLKIEIGNSPFNGTDDTSFGAPRSAKDGDLENQSPYEKIESLIQLEKMEAERRERQTASLRTPKDFKSLNTTQSADEVNAWSQITLGLFESMLRNGEVVIDKRPRTDGGRARTLDAWYFLASGLAEITSENDNDMSLTASTTAMSVMPRNKTDQSADTAVPNPEAALSSVPS